MRPYTAHTKPASVEFMKLTGDNAKDVCDWYLSITKGHGEPGYDEAGRVNLGLLVVEPGEFLVLTTHTMPPRDDGVTLTVPHWEKYTQDEFAATFDTWTAEDDAEACFDAGLKILETYYVPTIVGEDEQLDSDMVDKLFDPHSTIDHIVTMMTQHPSQPATKPAEEIRAMLDELAQTASEGDRDDRAIAREELREVLSRRGHGWLILGGTPQKTKNSPDSRFTGVHQGITCMRWFWARTYREAFEAALAWAPTEVEILDA